MQAFLSALGLLLSALMDFPARTKAVRDNRKASLGSNLAELVFRLDLVLQRADEMLSVFSCLAQNQDVAERTRLQADAIRITSQQIDDVRSIGRIIQHEFLWSFDYSDVPTLDRMDLLYTTTDVSKVLSIYKPDLGNQLQNIVEFKANLLVGLSRVLARSLSELPEREWVLRDIAQVAPEVLDGQIEKFDLEHGRYGDGGRPLIHFALLDLDNTAEVELYIATARQRLKELQTARTLLAEWIASQFKPEDIV